MKRIGIVITLAVLLIFGGLASADAYIPPAPFIIELMLEHLNVPSRMSVHQKLLIPAEPTGPAEAEPFSETEASLRTFQQVIRYRLPQSFRSDIQGDQFSRIDVSDAQNSITVVDGTVVSQEVDWEWRFKDLFIFRSRKRLVAHLSELGLDMKTASIGRMDKSLVYVVGATYPDETRPQIWIEKDFFRPLRWILSPNADPQLPPRHEIRYKEWQRVNKTWYPGRVVFFENGKKTKEMHIQTIDANPVFRVDLFDVELIRRKNEPQLPETGQGASESEIRRQIEQFKKIYE